MKRASTTLFSLTAATSLAFAAASPASAADTTQHVSAATTQYVAAAAAQYVAADAPATGSSNYDVFGLPAPWSYIAAPFLFGAFIIGTILSLFGFGCSLLNASGNCAEGSL